MTNEQGHQLPPLSPEALAVLGGGKIAYVKPINAWSHELEPVSVH